jgi:glutaredoxin
MFVGTDCHACHEQMEFLRRSGVAFMATNVYEDAPARNELVGLGSKTVPTTVVGDEVIIGFDRERLCAALGLVSEGI